MASRPHSPAFFWPAAGLVLVLGALLRFRALDAKPVHADEAVQAWQVAGLLEHGVYAYHPADFHGPLLYYLAAPLARLAGESDLRSLRVSTVRLLPAAAGLLVVVLILSLAPFTGRLPAVIGGGFCAVSPLLVVYSRHFVQEMLFVAFSLALVSIFLWWRRTRRGAWWILAGIDVGLLAATKESWPLVLAAVALGAAMSPRNPFEHPTERPRRLVAWVTAGVVVAILVVVLMFTRGFTHPAGLGEFARGLFANAEKTMGGPHAKPWHYYFDVLLWHPAPGMWWTEAWIAAFAVSGILAPALGWFARIRGRTTARCFAGYTLLLLLAHIVVPYKTIWLACGFWAGACVLAGFGAGAALAHFRRLSVRVPVATAVVAGLLHLAVQAHAASTRLSADPRNPYAYVQTSSDILRLPPRLRQLAATNPAGREMVIKVALPEYWPLPWLLRDFPNTGYWETLPPDLKSDVLLTSPELWETIPPETRAAWATEFFGLRENVLVVLAAPRDAWERSLSESAPPPSEEAR